MTALQSMSRWHAALRSWLAYSEDHAFVLASIGSRGAQICSNCLNQRLYRVSACKPAHSLGTVSIDIGGQYRMGGAFHQHSALGLGVTGVTHATAQVAKLFDVLRLIGQLKVAAIHGNQA
jgi:hypothetical protein